MSDFYYRSERTRWERTDHTALKNLLIGIAGFVGFLALAIIAMEIGGF